jgi:succinoglycan biosynthesis transport protein ExoP
MEIRQYLLLLRKWAWLLILGGVLGGLLSYGFSKFQPNMYQTSTKIMVGAAQQQDNSNYYSSYADIQLAQSYSQIITTDEIIQNLSDRLGYPVYSGQVRVDSKPDSQIIEITATDGDPERAAEIANTLVDVFIEYNNGLQDKRYKTTEDSLTSQIAQIEEQINTLQSEMSQITQDTVETQKQQIEDQSKQIEAMLASANDEVIKVETQLDTFFPTPEVTNTPLPSWVIPTATPVPVPTPTLSAADMVKYKELQTRRDQLNEMRDLFQNAYGNLLILQQQSTTDPALRQAQVQNTLALYQQIYSGLLTSYENVRLARLRSTPNIVQISKAHVPGGPVSPQPLRSALMGAMVGFMIMGGIAFGIEYLDDTLKTPEEVSSILHLPVIGLIAEMGGPKSRKSKREPGVFVIKNPLSPVSESFRTLRTNIDFASVDKPLKTLMITSPGPSEGKSTTAVNLAAIMAQGERKVILIDADLRRPAVHLYLDIPNRKGLSDMIRDSMDLPNSLSSWGNPPFAVITSGGLPPNPVELLASSKMEKILSELKGKADILIIDTPPGMFADPIALSAKVDGVLIVIEPGVTTKAGAQILMEQLHRSGARVVGVVLNPISKRGNHYYSRYQYYSSYYYGSRGYGHYYSKNGSKRKRSQEQPKQEESQNKPVE